MGTSNGVAHGALDHAELTQLGLRPEVLLDFSSNINPFGPPPGVRTALAVLDIASYPDRSCMRLRRALAERQVCEPEALLPGNGANELIHLIALALLQPGDTVLVIGPTYGEYAHAARLMGAQVVVVQAHPESAFQPDAEAIVALAERLRPQLIWLCTPNNPTGTTASPELVLALTEICAVYGGYVVLDRAYGDLQRPDAAAPPDELSPNKIEIHSLTKSYALAGLRLGFLRATPGLVKRIGAYQPVWSVSSAAQAAGLAALAEPAFLLSTVPQLWTASDELYNGIVGLGLRVWRAALPFLLVQTGDGAGTRAALLCKDCVVRDCASFGLPEWVRVAPRRPGDNKRLLAAWKECL